MEKVNKNDFVRMVSKRTGYAQADIRAVLETASNVAMDLLSDGKSVCIWAGVIFEPVDVPERDAINPRTRETIHVPARKRVKARFGTKYKGL